MLLPCALLAALLAAGHAGKRGARWGLRLCGAPALRGSGSAGLRLCGAPALRPGAARLRRGGPAAMLTAGA